MSVEFEKVSSMAEFKRQAFLLGMADEMSKHAIVGKILSKGVQLLRTPLGKLNKWQLAKPKSFGQIAKGQIKKHPILTGLAGLTAVSGGGKVVGDVQQRLAPRRR